MKLRKFPKRNIFGEDKRIAIMTLVLFSFSAYYYYKCLCIGFVIDYYGPCGEDFLCYSMNNFLPFVLFFGVPADLTALLYPFGSIILLGIDYLISVIFFGIFDSISNFVKKRKMKD